MADSCQPDALQSLAKQYQKDRSLFADRQGASLADEFLQHERVSGADAQVISRLAGQFESTSLSPTGWQHEFFSGVSLPEPSTDFRDFEAIYQQHVQTSNVEYDGWAAEFTTAGLVAQATIEDEHASWTRQFELHEAQLASQEIGGDASLHDAFAQAWQDAGAEQDQSGKLDFEQAWERAMDAAATHAPSGLAAYDAEYEFEVDNPYLERPEVLSLALSMKAEHAPLSQTALAFEAALQQHVTPLSDSDLTYSWLCLAQVQAENEKELAAIAAYKRCLSYQPKHAAALMGLAVSFTNEGIESEVLDLLARWLNAQYPEAHVHLEPAGPMLDRREQLLGHFLRVVRSQASGVPADPDLQVGLGILFYNASDYDKAIDCFSAALTSRPGDYLLWNRLGATLANSQRSEEAIAKYERALAIHPSFIRARHNLGVSCMNIGCYAEAAGHLLAALRTQPADHKNISSNLWETLRRNYVLMGRTDLAALCDTRDIARLVAAAI